MRKSLLAAFSVAFVSVGVLAVADGHAEKQQLEAAVKARKAQMQLYSFNLGTLGAMAKTEIAYDADVAAAAAGNLAALATINQSGYWLPGTDNVSMSGATRALPAIWAEGSTIGAKAGAFAAAVTAMDAAAGKDLASLQAAMGALGGACGDCHKAYRGPKN